MAMEMAARPRACQVLGRYLMYTIFGYKRIDLSYCLFYGGLMVMLFTTVWLYRYTRLASRITDSQRSAIVIIDKHV